MKSKAILDEAPKPKSETAIHKKVIHWLHRAFAKRASTVILPPPLLQAVDGPKIILNGKPGKKTSLLE
jgi:hypothetical protein